jgi:hypothetical protein
MRLPGVDGDARRLVDKMGNVLDGNDRRRPAEKEGEMTLAMRMRAHRLVQPIDGYAAKRSMTDR